MEWNRKLSARAMVRLLLLSTSGSNWLSRWLTWCPGGPPSRGYRTTFKPGDLGVTTDGTLIFLGSSNLAIGTRTETLSPSQATITSQPPYVSVGSRKLNFGPSAIIKNRTTLEPADPGITVDGILVAPGSSILVLSSHTQNLVLRKPHLLLRHFTQTQVEKP